MKLDDLKGDAGLPSLTDIRNCIDEFLLDREEPAPDPVRDAARAARDPASMKAMFDFVGTVYAYRTECGPLMLRMAAGACQAFVQGQFWRTKAAHFPTLIPIFFREAKVKLPAGMKHPAKKNDPDPDPAYLPPEEVEDDLPDAGDPAPDEKKDETKTGDG